MLYPAVLFDLFGTLIDNFTHSSLARSLREMAVAVDAPVEEFARGWADTYDARNRGGFPSPEANICAVCDQLGLTPTPAQVAAALALRFAYVRGYLVPRADTLPTLIALKASGRRLALVSDCALEIPALWPLSPFASLFDVTVFSALRKAKKPEPVMYLSAARELGVAPQDCLYVGDGSSRELSGAAAVGMHPVLIRAPHEDTPDSFRPYEEAWEGPRIRALAELLPLCGLPTGP